MAGLGLGLLSYNAENSINSSVFSEQKGGTFGFITTVSYFHFIGKNIAIGARIGYLAGTLSKIKTTVNGNTTEVKLDDDEKESLSQVSFNAGKRFNVLKRIRFLIHNNYIRNILFSKRFNYSLLRN